MRHEAIRLVHNDAVTINGDAIALDKNGAQIKLNEALIKKELDRLQLLEPQKKINAESEAYLAKTGWYVERLNDPSSGKAIPEKVLKARAAARAAHKDIE